MPPVLNVNRPSNSGFMSSADMYLATCTVGSARPSELVGAADAGSHQIVAVDDNWGQTADRIGRAGRRFVRAPSPRPGWCRTLHCPVRQSCQAPQRDDHPFEYSSGRSHHAYLEGCDFDRIIVFSDLRL
jgi:hypothetical protein